MPSLLLEPYINTIILENIIETSQKLKLHSPPASDCPLDIHPREILAGVYQLRVQDVHNHNIMIKSLRQPKRPLPREWHKQLYTVPALGSLLWARQVWFLPLFWIRAWQLIWDDSITTPTELIPLRRGSEQGIGAYLGRGFKNNPLRSLKSASQAHISL